MFEKLGELIVRAWPGILLAWFSVLIVTAVMAPPLDDVAETEEFALLPSTTPSHVAEKLFGEAFPKKLVPSRVVIVVRREQESGLQERDWKWIDNHQEVDAAKERNTELRQRLLEIAEKQGGLAQGDELADNVGAVSNKGGSPISAIRTYQDPTLGRLLKSKDGKATLVLVELTTDFLDSHNQPTVKAIEDLFTDPEFRQHIPAGLDLSLSGEATVGRDMQVAAKNSAKATETLTVVLVVILLIGIYRAPLLALIPLMTVFVSVKLTMSLLILMAERHWVTLFTGVESYVTVLLYGAGVDYCLFLIARYKEELDGGVSISEGVSNSVAKVGAAIAASAGTVICGIGMMMFAEFGKFRQAGFAISFGLVIVLLASLTFTPAFLRLVGRWAFYPQMRTERVNTSGGWLPTVRLASKLGDVRWMQNIWDSVGRLLITRPMTLWLVSLGLMMPFAVVGVMFYTHLSYGLLSDLPSNSASLAGTRAVQDHFPAGATGPITVLLKNDKIDFSQPGDEANPGGLTLIRELSKSLYDRRDELQLADVRSVSNPYGGEESIDDIINGLSPLRRKRTRDLIIEHYVSRQVSDHVTRLEITTAMDPFSRDSMKHLSFIQNEIGTLLQKFGGAGTTILITGSTASIRDLKTVTDGDQIRIDVLVVSSVFLILVLLLRRPAICLYLIITVLFSYLVALGATYLAYWAFDPANFAGLDWKVPMFLFTILIAVGEDYNIFLMTRIEEEQKLYGPVQGVIHALQKTGRIISSCGIIMAGTFCSLAAGSLRGMCQLGFALAFGVLLDTFVVRPILVPAYLVLLNSGRFGRLGPWLGALPPETAESKAARAETAPAAS
jgi:RND superfamily putative drug exporter